MVTIKTPAGPYSGIWTPLYQACSQKPLPDTLRVTDASVKAFVKLLYKTDGQKHPPKLIVDRGGGGLISPASVADQINFPKKALPKECWIGYSGGKDSIAAAIKLMRRGFNVTGCFVTGLCHSFDEKQAAIDTAAILGIKLHILPVSITGKSDRPENPTKNLLIVGLMADKAARLGVNHYALGTENEDDGDGTVGDAFNSDFNFSDSAAVLDAGRSVFKDIPGFTLYSSEVMHGSTDSYETVLSHKRGKEILAASRSCVAPFRFRKNWKRMNEEKYKAELLPGRCGSCYKCAIEYLHLEALGVVKPNRELAAHSWRILCKTGGRLTDIPDYKKAALPIEVAKDWFFDEKIQNRLPKP